MTPIYGITQDGEKRTGIDARVLPRTVIYDPELTLTLPVGMSVTSGINAIAHAAEGLYAANANPITNNTRVATAVTCNESVTACQFMERPPRPATRSRTSA